MEFENILYSTEDGVARIALNRPPMNVWDTGMREDVGRAIAVVRDDPAVRALVITTSGKVFSAGGDINAFAEGMTGLAGRARVQRTDQVVVTELLNLEKPVIAAVRGYAVGAGCNLAMACDVVFASEDAKFGEVFVRIGLMPDVCGIFMLPRLVGLHKAMELMFTGDIIDAAEAHRIGLVNHLVPAAELEGAALEMARRLAKGPTRAIGMTKVLLHRALSTDLAGAIELEALGQGICMQTDDHREGVRAFLEKRPPHFEGR